MAGEEKLISAAKQVASSTAQLLVACKVKMHAESPVMIRLQVSTCSRTEENQVNDFSHLMSFQNIVQTFNTCT